MLVLDALSMNPTSRRPVWVMRQAGRYMPAFRAMREKYSFEKLCLTPELATEITLLPMKRFSFDASIVFSDILFPLQALGAELKYTDQGPVLTAPKNAAELSKLKTSFEPKEGTPAILKTLSMMRQELPAEKALLGFAGAPFTMLTYLLEGKLSKDLKTIKRWMAEEPELVKTWLDRLASLTGKYLDAQAEAGADAVQLFDTWAGQLSPEDFENFALPYARKALSMVTVPSLYYVNGIAGVLESAASVGAQGLSIDWRITLGDARKRISQVTALQGNLDPHSLLLPKREIRERVFRMCESYGRGPGHIVNLGHGIVPEISEEAVEAFVSAAQEWR